MILTCLFTCLLAAILKSERNKAAVYVISDPSSITGEGERESKLCGHNSVFPLKKQTNWNLNRCAARHPIAVLRTYLEWQEFPEPAYLRAFALGNGERQHMGVRYRTVSLLRVPRT